MSSWSASSNLALGLEVKSEEAKFGAFDINGGIEDSPADDPFLTIHFVAEIALRIRGHDGIAGKETQSGELGRDLRYTHSWGRSIPTCLQALLKIQEVGQFLANLAALRGCRGFDER